jgi:hypothetical protein
MPLLHERDEKRRNTSGDVIHPRKEVFRKITSTIINFPKMSYFLMVNLPEQYFFQLKVLTMEIFAWHLW